MGIIMAVVLAGSLEAGQEDTTGERVSWEVSFLESLAPRSRVIGLTNSLA
jgi:hypothetical protein